jgi:hypothetical protein
MRIYISYNKQQKTGYISSDELEGSTHIIDTEYLGNSIMKNISLYVMESFGELMAKKNILMAEKYHIPVESIENELLKELFDKHSFNFILNRKVAKCIKEYFEGDDVENIYLLFSKERPLMISGLISGLNELLPTTKIVRIPKCNMNDFI